MSKREFTTCPHCKGEFEIGTPSSRKCSGAIFDETEKYVRCPLCKGMIDKNYFKHCQYRYEYEPEPRLNFKWEVLRWDIKNWLKKILP